MMTTMTMNNDEDIDDDATGVVLVDKPNSTSTGTWLCIGKIDLYFLDSFSMWETLKFPIIVWLENNIVIKLVWINCIFDVI